MNSGGEERGIEWAQEDVITRLDAVGLQVLDRMLRQDEERRAEAGSGDEEGEGDDSGQGTCSLLWSSSMGGTILTLPQNICQSSRCGMHQHASFGRPWVDARGLCAHQGTRFL